ncbi:hypothetical protein P3T35_000500 [Kitasatospora sp. GP30]|uniref:hypothetical protein n=1 Tax=Kitasatospora sp. GP30 TaxID=3035084 RepID=UPI000C70F2FB|nr:hypothetical protein [Kitasatospora sp. GP30]MDH6138523.1 hypothetical protein [Kitasatospora sp. GP30]
MKIIDVQHVLTCDQPARSRRVLSVLADVGTRFDRAAEAVREVAPRELAALPAVQSLAVGDWGCACRALVALDAFLAAGHAEVSAGLADRTLTMQAQLRWSFVAALHTMGSIWHDIYLSGSHYVISPDLPIRPGVTAGAHWSARAAASAASAHRWADLVTVSHFREMSELAAMKG